MFSHNCSLSPSSMIDCSDTSFSSDSSCVIRRERPSPIILRQLVVRDLDDIDSIDFNHQRPLQRDIFRIPRPILTIPRSSIYLPTSEIIHHSEQPFYQNLPVIPPTPPPLPPLNQCQIEKHISTNHTNKTCQRPPCLLTTLFIGGFYTFIVLIYIVILFTLPLIKLIFGLLYVKQCPVNENIPLYMIVSGSCGVAFALLVIVSSACKYYRSTPNLKRSTDVFLLCTNALARALKTILTIFLFVWFFVGNIWVFNARSRVRTDRTNDLNNYCHPTLYWSTFYILIYTYIHAIFACCIKFCINFFCCGACNSWHKAFS